LQAETTLYVVRVMCVVAVLAAGDWLGEPDSASAMVGISWCGDCQGVISLQSARGCGFGHL